MSKNSRLTIHDIIEIKNLVTLLARHPYTSFLKNIMRPYFEAILGQEEVDRHILVNEKRATTIQFNIIKNMIIKFMQKYYPESLPLVIDKLYEGGDFFIIKEELVEYCGDIFLDDLYFSELEKKNQNIYSFIGKRMYVRGSINIIAAPPGGGKSLFLLTEALHQAIINNNKVYLVVVGDMDEYAVFKRARAIFNQNFEKSEENMKRLRNNLKFCIEKYGNLSSFTLAKRVEKSEFDFVIIDYDDNLVSHKDNNMLYIEAAQPYVDMDRVKDGRVIIFAAQGKPASWKDKNNIALGFLAASSRKEHIADSIYVMRPEKKNGYKFYELFVLKDRHGLNGAGAKLAFLTIEKGVLRFFDPDKIE